MNRLHLAPSEIAFLVPIFQTIYQKSSPRNSDNKLKSQLIINSNSYIGQ